MDFATAQILATKAVFSTKPRKVKVVKVIITSKLWTIVTSTTKLIMGPTAFAQERKT